MVNNFLPETTRIKSYELSSGRSSVGGSNGKNVVQLNDHLFSHLTGAESGVKEK